MSHDDRTGSGNADADGLLDINPHRKPDRFGRSEWWCYLDWSYVEKRGRITGTDQTPAAKVGCRFARK